MSLSDDQQPFVDSAARDAESTTLAVAVIVGIGCVSLVAQRFVRRTLNCKSMQTLSTSYRERYFLRVALSEMVALGSFVVAVTLRPHWVYFIGAAFTFVGFWRVAPTRRHLQQDQDQLSLSGCQLSLTAALRTPAS